MPEINDNCEYTNQNLITRIEKIYPQGERIGREKQERLMTINYWLNRYSRSEQIEVGRMGHNFRDLYWDDVLKIFKDIEDYKISQKRRKVFSEMVKSQALFELSNMFGYDVRKEEDIRDIYMYFVNLGDGDIQKLFR